MQRPSPLLHKAAVQFNCFLPSPLELSSSDTCLAAEARRHLERQEAGYGPSSPDAPLAVSLGAANAQAKESRHVEPLVPSGRPHVTTVPAPETLPALQTLHSPLQARGEGSWPVVQGPFVVVAGAEVKQKSPWLGGVDEGLGRRDPQIRAASLVLEAPMGSPGAAIGGRDAKSAAEPSPREIQPCRGLDLHRLFCAPLGS